MDYRNNAYGIGQRRVVNDAPSFAPIRGNGGGGGIDDNFRSPQSMNYGFNSNSSNNNNGNNSSNDFNFGNNNSQRFASMDSKFGNMQSNNYSRSSDNSGYGGGGGQNQQRFGNHTNSSYSSSGNFNDSNNYRGQMNQRSLGDQQQQQQQQRSNNMSDFNRSSSSGDYSSSGYSSFRGSLQPPPQQPPQLGNLSLGRSINDQGYNNSNNNNDSNNGNQRFYNNDRNDTFRRADNFSDNFNRGQESINSSRSGGGGNNYKFNNERSENFGRQVNNGGSNNFGYQNQNNQNRGGGGGGGGFDDNFRGSNLNNHNFDNNNKNNQQQQQFLNDKQNGPRNGDSGFSNVQNFRGQNNGDMPIGGQALAAINETVNALMTNQSNWQVGNNNNGFGQGNFNGGGGGGGGNYRNNASNRNNNNNMNNAGNNRNFNNGPAQTGNWANNRSQQQQQQQQPRNFKPVNNKPQGAPVAARGAAGGSAKFQGNKNQNQPKPNTNTNKPVVQQTNKKNVNATNNNKQQQPANQAVAKNVNGGQKPPQPKAAVPAKAAQNTQVKPKQEVKKEAAVVNPKVAPKRPAPQPAAPLTKADIKRRKLALKRGFLLGGIKLPYVNSNRVALPQPEDKSYAVMFFEQSLNYSTSGEELDDDAEFDGPEAIPEATDAEGKNAGRTLVKRIRKRLHFEWTQVEESKKYKSWPTWWTDYKWCEKAIQAELETFGSVNLRNCFLPDLPRLTTEQVVDVIVKQAHFGLDKNSDNYFNNMKSILTLMNVTFLENLKMPNSEKVQDMIRAVPNDFWCYKMRSMVYLWAQYLKISKTSSPSTETGVKELQAIARDWKNPLFHWMAKQAYDELKAISEVEWPEHKQQYEELQSAAPTSS